MNTNKSTQSLNSSFEREQGKGNKLFKYTKQKLK